MALWFEGIGDKPIDQFVGRVCVEEVVLVTEVEQHVPCDVLMQTYRCT